MGKVNLLLTPLRYCSQCILDLEKEDVVDLLFLLSDSFTFSCLEKDGLKRIVDLKCNFIIR